MRIAGELSRLRIWDDPVVDGGWESLWPAFQQAYDELVAPRAVAEEQELRRELLFCLLGGHGITFELNRSALSAVEELDVFAPSAGPTLHDDIVALLEEPRFEPRRIDGSGRRYRFPRRKAALICAARDWVLMAGSLSDQLDSRASERDRRSWLVGCPGLGAKSASWLLRNTGWASQLAILDVHVLRAMTSAGVIKDARLPDEYEEIERRFLEWCQRIGAAPGVFDLFLWEWQRGSLTTGSVAVVGR
jgi:thermostable 8-oxoguanine DNA glycosylase